jgi:hypothetical protein
MSTARGITPSSGPPPRAPPRAGGPLIVCVLPLPVCPYAKMHTRYPSSALCTSPWISPNTCACPSAGPNTLSNVKADAGCPRPPARGATRSASSTRSPTLPGRPGRPGASTAPCAASRSPSAGRMRQKTRMLPLSACTVLCRRRRTASSASRACSSPRACARSASSSAARRASSCLQRQTSAMPSPPARRTRERSSSSCASWRRAARSSLRAARRATPQVSYAPTVQRGCRWGRCVRPGPEKRVFSARSRSSASLRTSPDFASSSSRSRCSSPASPKLRSSSSSSPDCPASCARNRASSSDCSSIADLSLRFTCCGSAHL